MIPKRFESVVLAFFMSLLMTILMSGVITFINLGIIDDFFMLWLEAFRKTFVFAFLCVLIVVPFTRKIVAKLITQP